MISYAYQHKLTNPDPSPRVLHRPALVARLNEAVGISSLEEVGDTTFYKLILICAPAGYGKTTLLADFTRHASIPYCWYTLDQGDEDVSVFLTMLIASIRRRFPGFGLKLDAQLNNAIAMNDQELLRQHFEIVIDKLAAAIADEISSRFALILCDYHEVSHNQEIRALLSRFIDHLPSQCVLLLESRTISKLDIVSLLARRKVLCLADSDLRFSIEEIIDIARMRGVKLTLSEATHLEQSFDGWITGILLGTRLGNLGLTELVPGGGNPVVKMEQEYLFTYVAREVFAHEEEAYAFLKEACVLRQMTPDLCAALLNLSDPGRRLAYFEEQGLFVTRYGTGTEACYVCHPVLRELFYKDLAKSSPAHLKELHRKAFFLLCDSQPGEAIFHAMAAQEFELAAEQIARIGKQQFAQGRLVTLARWIDALPEKVVSQCPEALLLRAQIFLEASQLELARVLLDRAQIALQAAPGKSSLLAEVRLAHVMLLMQQGDYARARDIGQQVLTLLTLDELALRASAHQLLGSCAAYFNDFITSIAELQQALQLYTSTSGTRQMAKVHTLLANFYSIVGDEALSLHHRGCAIQLWEELNDEWGYIDDLIGLGSTKQRQGAFLEAEQIYSKALDASRKTASYACGEAYALANLGDLYLDRDEYQAALPFFEEGLARAGQIRETYLENYVICKLAMTYLLMGDTLTALKLLARFKGAQLRPEDIQKNEQGFYALAMGMAQLQIGKYDEAYAYLSASKRVFADAKSEQIGATLSFAACLLAQGKEVEASRNVEEAVDLARRYNYEYLIQIEFKRHPALCALLPVDNQSASQESLLPEIIAPVAGPVVEDIHLTTHTRTLSIQALGEPTVLIDGQPIRHWRLAKSMELFFLLLNAGRPLHKERIVAALWSAADLPSNQSLRSTLHYLRKVLDPASLVYCMGAYSLDLAGTYYKYVYYDVGDFQGHYTQARAALAEKKGQEAQELFEHIVSLYRGDYLRSIYSDWCVSRREELRQMYMDAHQQLAWIALQQQLFEKSIHHWQQLLALDNCLETAHEGLINCYLQQGNQAIALRQYQQSVETLSREIGASPGPALQRLYQRITAGT